MEVPEYLKSFCLFYLEGVCSGIHFLLGRQKLHDGIILFF